MKRREQISEATETIIQTTLDSAAKNFLTFLLAVTIPLLEIQAWRTVHSRGVVDIIEGIGSKALSSIYPLIPPLSKYHHLV
jgi:hypothetical protein